jgi:hypothetical protein
VDNVNRRNHYFISAIIEITKAASDSRLEMATGNHTSMKFRFSS